MDAYSDNDEGIEGPTLTRARENSRRRREEALERDLPPRVDPGQVDLDLHSAAAVEALRNQFGNDSGDNFRETRPRELQDIHADNPNEGGFQPEVTGTGLASDDPLSGDAMRDAIYYSWSPPNAQTPEDKFDATAVSNLSLKTLRKQYRERDTDSLLGHLSRPTELTIPDEWTISPNAHNLYPTSFEANMDYIWLFPNRAGCELIAPVVGRDAGFEFLLDLNDRASQYRNKKADALFDPTGRMLRVGLYKHMNVFIGMLEADVFERVQPDADAGPVSVGNTSMPRKHFLALALYIAKILKAAGMVQLYCLEEYASLDDEDEYHRTTNILYESFFLSHCLSVRD